MWPRGALSFGVLCQQEYFYLKAHGKHKENPLFSDLIPQGTELRVFSLSLHFLPNLVKLKYYNLFVPGARLSALVRNIENCLVPTSCTICLVL